ncbi:MAG: hypothetical protein ACE5H0_00750 [Bacteroidota bacterium]
MKLEPYWEAVRHKVCANCVDGDGKGNCKLSGENWCGLQEHFPLIVQVVKNVHSDSLGEYIVALRDIVCAQCRHQSPDGLCRYRQAVDCGLDRYFPMVVQAIEEAELKLSFSPGR